MPPAVCVKPNYYSRSLAYPVEVVCERSGLFMEALVHRVQKVAEVRKRLTKDIGRKHCRKPIPILDTKKTQEKREEQCQ